MDIKKFSELLVELPAADTAPSSEWAASAQRALRVALVLEMRRRGLWTSPPRYLGVMGASRWPEGLDELVADAYAFVFVERLSALRAQRRVRENVDGVVVHSLRHFLHERQVDNDRLGFLAFSAVRGAVAEQVEQGRLFVLAGDPAIRNHSVLARDAESPASPAAAELVAEVASAWNDTLLPELLTGHGRGRVVVAERLDRLLAELPERGVAVFRFGDLVEPMKADLRRRWSATFEHEGEVEQAPDRDQRWLSPFAAAAGRRLDFADKQHFSRLVHCVYQQVESLAENETLRTQLEQLWSCLHGWARGEGEEQPPSGRGLASWLGVSRERAEVLLQRLRTHVETCQRLLAGKVAELGNGRATV